MKAERGAVAVIMVTVVALIAVVTLAAASLALAFSAKIQAATAADAAALAAAVATYPAASRGEPFLAARAAAAHNHAALVWCDCPVNPSLEARTVGVRTQVVVDLPMFGRLGINGAARAEFDPRRWLGR